MSSTVTLPFIIKHFLLLSFFLYVGMGIPHHPIVKHVLFIKYKDHVSQSTIDKLSADYANLKNLEPELKDWQWGVDLGPAYENRSEGYHHAYETTFYSVDGFMAFMANPQTKKFGREFWPAVEKAVVLNYVLNETYPPRKRLPYKRSPTVHTDEELEYAAVDAM